MIENHVHKIVSLSKVIKGFWILQEVNETNEVDEKKWIDMNGS